MNKKQYNNVIEHTLKHEVSAQTEDSLETVRAIFNNMGVALPQGDMKHVYEVIKSDDYMGWKSCTMQEAQEAANNGTAAIGISEDRIVVLAAVDEEEPVEENTAVMTISEEALDGDMEYYTYSATVTRPSLYGWAGTYRKVYDPDVDCLEYALLHNTDTGLKTELQKGLLEPTLNSAYYRQRVINYIYSKYGMECRKLDDYQDTINSGEYRMAARLPFKDGYYFHFIYQLGDGTWAGKDAIYPSEHFGMGNPDNSPEMWANDKYSPEAGTIYFAVKRW